MPRSATERVESALTSGLATEEEEELRDLYRPLVPKSEVDETEYREAWWGWWPPDSLFAKLEEPDSIGVNPMDPKPPKLANIELGRRANGSVTVPPDVPEPARLRRPAWPVSLRLRAAEGAGDDSGESSDGTDRGVVDADENTELLCCLRGEL